MPKITLGIAGLHEILIRDHGIEQHYWDPPHERKPVGTKSLISNEHLILNGVNPKILSVGRYKRFELVC